MHANTRLVDNGFQYVGSDFVKGTLISFGAFPGLLSFGSTHIAVDLYSFEDDEQLEPINHYEGYDPERPENSLYVMIALPLVNNPETEVLVYEYNGTIHAVNGRDVVASGDWANCQRDKPRILPERHPYQAS
jgi:gamma-glutamylcyclotransferase (GGCT)/AIG2-like uncharacterized protein YtfP